MNFVQMGTQPDFLIAVLVAICVAALIFTFGAQLTENKGMKHRIKNVAMERERLRAQEISRLRGENKSEKRKAETSNLVNDIVERLSLKKAFADEQTSIKLSRAGYRGSTAVTMFVFMRFILPFVTAVLAFIYFMFVLDKSTPLFVSLTYSIGVGILGSYLPVIWLKNETTKRQKIIRRAWPDALDLILLCVESGMSIELAFKRVAHEIMAQSPILGEELTLTTAELSFLGRRAQAYENLADRTGLEGVRAVMTALIQSDKYGTSVGNALRVMADEGREMRMMEAEKKAASIPPKLTVPLIIFFLPVLFIVIMSPAIILATQNF